VLRLFKFLLIAVAVTHWVAPALTCGTAPREQTSYTLQGTVTDSAGTPVIDARVVIARGDKSRSASRNTRTDSDGKWKFQQVKNGQWKIQAFSREAISEIYHVTISWRKKPRQLIPIHLKVNITSGKILAEGKSHLYNHQWETAGKAFDFYCHNFPNSRRGDEALFWNAYTCFRRARTSTTNSDADPSDLRERSLQLISRLLKEHATGKWTQDARILRLDIWSDQFRSGHRSDLEPVMKAADPKIEPEVQVRRAAIEILIPIKPGFAWNALQREFSQMKEAKLRRNILVLFSRFELSKSIPALKDIAEKDPDSLVRAGAQYWLHRMDRQRTTPPAGAL